jgi:hypothetical protein
LVFCTGIFLTAWMLCAGIFILAAYYVLAYFSCLNCWTGIFILPEYVVRAACILKNFNVLTYAYRWNLLHLHIQLNIFALAFPH